jgi:hypothetical protein
MQQSTFTPTRVSRRGQTKKEKERKKERKKELLMDLDIDVYLKHVPTQILMLEYSQNSFLYLRVLC